MFLNSRALMSAMAVIIGTLTTNSVAMDIRKFSLEFPHNKQDEKGDTFWH